jgi:DNA-binding Lrp family transcriptional regulator
MAKTETIDEVDAKILRDLLREGRKEFVQIAREIKVSKDIVWQHYANLKRKGIIIGSTVQINYRSLGYGGAASFFVDTPIEEQANVAKQMRKISGIYDVYRWGSYSRLWAVSDFMKVDRIEQVKMLIKRIPSVLRVQVEIWVDYRRVPDNLSVLTEVSNDNSKEKTESKINSTKIFDMDDVDWKLIQNLMINGRASFNEIGKQLGISPSTATRRYNSLSSCGIIRAIIQINPMKIGYSNAACFRMTINPEDSIADISDSICKIPDTVGFVRTVGTYDLSVFTGIKDLKHLWDIEAQIAGVHGVGEMSTPTLNEFSILPYRGEHTSSF